jgi:hypothetical protein
MSSDRWRQIESIYHEALKRRPVERSAYLDEACGGDPDLRREVESLLAQDASGDQFLERPLIPTPPDSQASTLSGTTEESASRAAVSEDIDADVAREDEEYPVPVMAPGASDGWFVDRLLQVVPWLATTKILVALMAIAIQAVSGDVVQHVAELTTIRFSVLLVASFTGGAVVLWRVAPSDPRARALAGDFVVTAASVCRILLTSGHELGGLSNLLARTRLDVFTALLFWSFVRDFPFRVTAGATAAWPTRLVRFSALAGTIVLLVNFLVDLDNAFWPFLVLLTLPAAAVLIERIRYVGPGDRRRVVMFVITFLAGLVPIALDIVLQGLWPAWAAFVHATPLVPTIVLFALLTVPFTTAYSVVVDRVLDLALAARAAMQYALARSTLLLLIIAPLVWTAWAAYHARSATIGEFLSSQPMPMGAAIGALLVLMPVRHRVVRVLDRHFFREQYDTDVILSRLVDASRRAGSVSELTDLLTAQIEAALHPRRLAILVRRGNRGRFDVSGGSSRSLPMPSTLADLLGASDEPVEIKPHNLSAALSALDTATLAWLADSDFRLLVPLRGAAGSLNGIIALGEKRSELSYSARDRRMLMAVGATGGVWLDTRGGELGDTEPGAAAPDDSAARECRTCGRLFDEPRFICTCGGEMQTSGVPRVLADKFEIEQRIGTGGMGAVYRATDMTLGRTVAVKALHGRHPRDAWRLRHEARAMALITHPNLATVFGLEFWFARPFLIVEYVGGGTLADRLRRGSLPEREVAAVGTALARVLGTLHAAGLLHRDVKPANIGFSHDGVVKLLDFGLARPISGAESSVMYAQAMSNTAEPPRTLGGRVVGTPLYMSPEALAGESPDETFDLWGLAVSLFEAMSGVNPYKRLGTAGLLSTRPAPDLRAFTPDARDGAVQFFMRVLSPSKRARPSSAQSFIELLDECFK